MYLTDVKPEYTKMIDGGYHLMGYRLDGRAGLRIQLTQPVRGYITVHCTKTSTPRD